MKNSMKTPMRLECAFIALLLILGMGTAAFAENKKEINSVTFTNAHNDITGISVTKTVTNISSVPEEMREKVLNTEFSFQMLLDGNPARGSEYMKFNSEGERVLLLQRFGEAPFECLESNIPEGQNYDIVDFSTDDNGIFTLKHGERIVFTGVPAGTQALISEYPQKGFKNVSGDINLTAPKEGIAAADFDNRYQTNNTPPGTPGKLYVTKQIKQPAGYDIADNGPFTFKLADGSGQPMAKIEYYIEGKGGKLKTGVDGSFQLFGDETAVFEIPADTEFILSEESSDGWRFIEAGLEKNGVETVYADEPVIHHATAASGDTRVRFVNAKASFGVKKTLTSESVPTDKEFSFYLTDGEGKKCMWKEYWIYDSNGHLVSSDETDTVHSTGESGTFALQAGQTAMFFGLPEGTVVTVNEIADAEYALVSPGSDGYMNKSVTDTVQVYEFVNQEIPKEVSVSVTKKVKNLSDKALPDVEFVFQIFKVTDGTENPCRMAYTITEEGGAASFSTDENGIFTLKANQTALFDNKYVHENDYYIVKELKPSAYVDKFITEDGDTREGVVTDEGLSLTFMNDYGDFTEFNFYKIAEYTGSGKTRYLPGAVFSLTAGIEDGGSYIWSDNKNDIRTAVSDDTGYVSFKNLTEGVYKLSETVPPEGYCVSQGYWVISVDEEGKYSMTDVGSPNAFRVNEANQALELPNREMLTLPHSGSTGELTLMVVSTVLMITGVFSYLVIRKKYVSGHNS